MLRSCGGTADDWMEFDINVYNCALLICIRRGILSHSAWAYLTYSIILLVSLSLCLSSLLCLAETNRIAHVTREKKKHIKSELMRKTKRRIKKRKSQLPSFTYTKQLTKCRDQRENGSGGASTTGDVCWLLVIWLVGSTNYLQE